MNFKFVIAQLGMLLIVIGVFLVAAGAWGIILWKHYDVAAEQASAEALLGSGFLGIVIGFIPKLLSRKQVPKLGRREAFLLVALSWIVGAALAATPFFLWSILTEARTPAQLAFSNYINCYFESMSGFTTTGATILPHVEDLPHSLLLWRATTHWLGGLGIIVLFVAVLPTLGAGGKKLFQVESPGPQPSGVRPQIASTARILWIIYLGMTVVEATALRIAGMSWFDAICHTFATLATGGFSTRDASVSAFQSVPIETIIIIFMILAGINFGLYYQLIRGRIKSFFADPELRLYLAIVGAACFVVILLLFEERIVDTTGAYTEPSVGAAIRHGVFQVVSIITTTGFCTADFDQWGFFPKAILLGIIFIGASAGSTGGGIKVIRVLILFKVLKLEVERVFRPNVVCPLKIGDTPVSQEMRLSTLAYVIGILLFFLVGALLIMGFEVNSPALTQNGQSIDFTTAASAAAATLNNIGPGLALVGAVKNYAWFSNESKIVMTVLMAVGRLEIFAILVLFVPRFWRGD